MAPANDAEKEERLKAALWYSVGQTIDSISLDKDINATPHFIGAMSEMLWAQIGSENRLYFFFVSSNGSDTLQKTSAMI